MSPASINIMSRVGRSEKTKSEIEIVARVSITGVSANSRSVHCHPSIDSSDCTCSAFDGDAARRGGKPNAFMSSSVERICVSGWRVGKCRAQSSRACANGPIHLSSANSGHVDLPKPSSRRLVGPSMGFTASVCVDVSARIVHSETRKKPTSVGCLSRSQFASLAG